MSTLLAQGLVPRFHQLSKIKLGLSLLRLLYVLVLNVVHMYSMSAQNDQNGPSSQLDNTMNRH